MPTSSQQSVGIEIHGLQQLDRALRQLSPDVGKQMNRSIRTSLNKVRDTARGRIGSDSPMSGWSTSPARRGRTRGGQGWPAFDAGAARAGITVRKGSEYGLRSGVSVAWRVRSENSVATIIDKAATSHSARGRQFIANLDRRSGKSQRILWPAWLATRRVALTQIRVAVSEAEKALQERADKIDGRV